MAELTKELRERLYKLGTTNISDAMDALGFSNVCAGITPLYESCKKIVGPPSRSGSSQRTTCPSRSTGAWKPSRTPRLAA